MQLQQSRFKSAEYVRNVWAVTPEEGTKIEDVLKPEYWAHIAVNLKPWDRIEVRAEDQSFYAELIVIQSTRSWAKVRIIHLIELNEVLPEGSSIEGYTVKWCGPHAKWRVIRESDKAVIREGEASEVEARKWLDEHLRVTA